MTALLPPDSGVVAVVPARRPPIPTRRLEVAGLMRRTHDLLASRVPLTLLIDIGDPAGPHSTERFTDEGGDAGWLVPTKSPRAE